MLSRAFSLGYVTFLCRFAAETGGILTSRLRVSGSSGSPEISNDFPARIGAGSAGQSAAGVSAGAAKVESFEWSAVLSPTDKRAKGEKLIDRVFAVKDVSAAEAVALLQVERGDDLAVNDQVAEVWSVAGKGSNNRIAELFAPRIPAAVFQFIRSILNVDGHHVRAFRREGRVGK